MVNLIMALETLTRLYTDTRKTDLGKETVEIREEEREKAAFERTQRWVADARVARFLVDNIWDHPDMDVQDAVSRMREENPKISTGMLRLFAHSLKIVCDNVQETFSELQRCQDLDGISPEQRLYDAICTQEKRTPEPLKKPVTIEVTPFAIILEMSDEDFDIVDPNTNMGGFFTKTDPYGKTRNNPVPVAVIRKYGYSGQNQVTQHELGHAINSLVNSSLGHTINSLVNSSLEHRLDALRHSEYVFKEDLRKEITEHIHNAGFFDSVDDLLSLPLYQTTMFAANIAYYKAEGEVTHSIVMDAIRRDSELYEKYTGIYANSGYREKEGFDTTGEPSYLPGLDIPANVVQQAKEEGSAAGTRAKLESLKEGISLEYSVARLLHEPQKAILNVQEIVTILKKNPQMQLEQACALAKGELSREIYYTLKYILEEAKDEILAELNSDSGTTDILNHTDSLKKLEMYNFLGRIGFSKLTGAGKDLNELYELVINRNVIPVRKVMDNFSVGRSWERVKDFAYMLQQFSLENWKFQLERSTLPEEAETLADIHTQMYLAEYAISSIYDRNEEPKPEVTDTARKLSSRLWEELMPLVDTAPALNEVRAFKRDLDEFTRSLGELPFSGIAYTREMAPKILREAYCLVYGSKDPDLEAAWEQLKRDGDKIMFEQDPLRSSVLLELMKKNFQRIERRANEP
jgi:hypothetical protein